MISGMSHTTKRPGYLAFSFVSTCLVLLIFFAYSLWTTDLSSVAKLTEEEELLSAANSTLGFEKIIALSRGTKWRLHGLEAAANLTGLKIDVPQQPYISETQVEQLMQSGSLETKKPKHGSAVAWIAHLDLLKHIVQSGYATTLIIEDDIDWAVEIKSQMSTLSQMVRKYTQTSSRDSTPYGSSWDILWLGHCGEWYDPEHPPKLQSWDDPTVGRRTDWRGVYGKEWLEDLPEGQRHLFWSVSPICTYGYAVTLDAAQKILKWASDGQGEAYDIHLASGCQAGAVKCLSIVDQLFHHYRPPQDVGQGSDIDDETHQFAGELGDKAETSMGSTAVILHSARCQALFGTTCLDTSEMSERPYR